MTNVNQPLVTVDEFLAMPDDGIERDLINGRIGEYGSSMTRRNFRHTRTEANIVGLLKNWVAKQPPPRGVIVSGEAGVRLGHDDRTTVGIDVAYISAEVVQATAEDAALIERPPILAVEILSPSDKQEDILDKVRSYLDACVCLVWIVEPVFRTVSVFRPEREPALFNTSQELLGDPHLPGLRIAVNTLFAS
jgi:Uma2 family endonuclease